MKLKRLRRAHGAHPRTVVRQDHRREVLPAGQERPLIQCLLNPVRYSGGEAVRRRGRRSARVHPDAVTHGGSGLVVRGVHRVTHTERSAEDVVVIQVGARSSALAGINVAMRRTVVPRGAPVPVSIFVVGDFDARPVRLEEVLEVHNILEHLHNPARPRVTLWTLYACPLILHAQTTGILLTT